MSEETKTGIRTEGELALPNLEPEKDNSTESSTEKTNTDQTQSSDGEQKSDADKDGGEKKGKSKGLSEHPRWKKREADWKKRYNQQEVRQTKEITDLRKDMEAKIAEAGTSNQQSSPKATVVPSWFGGTKAQWREYQAYQKKERGQSEDNAVNRITSKTEGEQKAIKEATDYLNSEMNEIELDEDLNPSGKKIDRNKLLKFVLDNDLVDSQGKWNYKAGFRMMQSGAKSVKAKNTSERKKLAGATTSEAKGETKQSTIKTSEDFSKPGAKPW